MLSLKRIPCVEADDFDGTDLKQIAHFDIPADGIYDLSRSCLVFPTNIYTTEGEGNPPGVHNVALRFRPQSLIKNCEISCQRGGVMESRTHNNFLNVNLNKYIYGKQLDESGAYLEGRSSQDEFGNYYSAFRYFGIDAANPTFNLKHELKIPLRHLFSIGSFPQYPASATGTTRIQVEFQKSVSAPAWNGTSWATNLMEETPRYTSEHTLAFAHPSAAEIAAGGVTIHTTSISKGNTTPFWEGQLLNIRNNDVTRQAIIETIVREQSPTHHYAWIFKITFDRQVVTHESATTGWEEHAASFKYEVTEPELLLYQISPSPHQLKSAMSKLKRGSTFPFKTWVLEQDHMQESVEFNKQYYLNPNCSTALFLGQEQATDDVLECSMPNLANFRCQLNNQDLTTQDIVPNDYLYRDRQMWSLSNAGIPMGKVVGNLGANLIANPVPPVPVQQPLTITMRALPGHTITAGNLKLYKQVQRVLKISGGSVQVN